MVRLFTIIYFVIFSINLFADISLNQYVRRSWHVEEGLPHENIQAIAQTEDGYIWLGTHRGVVRFDGVTFTLFNTTNQETFSSNYITTIQPGSDNRLWIGTTSGLLLWSHGKFMKPFEKKIDRMFINNLFFDKNDNLWISADRGLFVIDQNLERKTILSDIAFHAVAQVKKNLFIVASDSHLYKITVSEGRYLAEKIIKESVTELLLTKKYGLLAAVFEKGLGVVKGKTIKIVYPHKKISALHEDLSGNIWVSADSTGVLSFTDNLKKATTSKVCNSVRAIHQDREKNLWIGCDKNGLHLFYKGPFSTYTKKDGLPDNMVLSVYEDSKKQLWVGTESGGVNIYDGNEFKKFTKKDGLGSNMILTFLEDASGKMWVGTYGGGLTSISAGKQVQKYENGEILSSNIITSIIDEKTGLLVGTWGDGVYTFKDEKFEKSSINQFLPDKYIRFIYVDKHGKKWIGTNNGLLKYSSESALVYTRKHGFLSDEILAISEDINGNIWIGTENGGLHRYNDGRFISFSMRDGLPEDTIYSILPDHNGNLWLGTPIGVLKVSVDELEKKMSGTQISITYEIFGKNEGMKSRECNGGFQSSAWKSHDGRLWFATTIGVSSVHPGKIIRNPYKPPVYIEAIEIDEKNIPLTGTVVIPAQADNITLSYTALSYRQPDNVFFKYKLEGANEKWMFSGNKRHITLSNLYPDSYIFKLAGSNNENVWNMNGALIKLIKQPHFYQTLWFRVMTVFIIMVILYLLHKLRIKHIQQKNKRLQKLIEEKAEELIAQSEEVKEINNELKEKYEQSKFDDETAASLIQELRDAVEKDKLYLDPEISLTELAEKTDLTPHNLSQLINCFLNQNFYTFINSYRLEEAKRQLLGDKKKSILAVAYDSGFSNKSTFNTLFKKNTGMTPSVFRKNNDR